VGFEPILQAGQWLAAPSQSLYFRDF
jgi:hypothetical protein